MKEDSLSSLSSYTKAHYICSDDIEDTHNLKTKEERPTSWLAIRTINKSLRLVGSYSPAERYLLGETMPGVFLLFPTEI